MLLGQKVNPRVARMRTLPEGIDQRSACRHPDWTGPDDLAIKIQELREITDWEKPIYVKVGATRVFHDVKLAVHCRRRRGRGRRHAGRHRRHADVLHRARRHPHAGGGAAGGRRAGRPEHEGQGAAHRLRRHPHRRRRGQGAGDGRRRGVDRPGRADGARLQQRHATCRTASTSRRDRRLRGARHRARLLPPLPHRPLPGRRHHAGRGARAAPAAGGGAQAPAATTSRR